MNLLSLLSLMGLVRDPRRLHEAQLRAMSSRELADLGIGSSEIPAVLCADAQPNEELPRGAHWAR